jgi:putative membrane protein insertion efficiency factor
MRWLLLALIRVYQLTLSRVLFAVFGPVCRFEPSCSSYAAACIQGHGVLRGSLLSVKRLCRCHPFHPGGYDPPPPPRLTAQGREQQENGF